MFDNREVFLLIDIKLDKINDDEMETVFQQVFGTCSYTGWAREIYYHRAGGCRYQYCYKSTTGCIHGYTSRAPVERAYPNTTTVTLSSLISGGTSIGTL